MSYGVCHMQKFTSGSVKGIEIHNQREKIGISHSNPDIDWSKSDLNYDLHNEEIKSYNKTIKNRVSQLDLKKAVRKDAIVMCGFIVTSDKEYFENKTAGETKQYFQDSYEFLKERYGADNVISATVHLDETTPHLHFNFVPVTADGRLSAKSIFTRSELNSLQTDFYKSVGEKHGLERGIEGSNSKHIEIARLKVQTATQEVIQAEKAIKPLVSEKQLLEGQIQECGKLVKSQRNLFSELNNSISSLREERDSLENITKDLKSNVQPLEKEKEILEQEINQMKTLMGEVSPIREKTAGIGKNKKVVEVTMSKQTYDACVSAHLKINDVEQKANEIEKGFDKINDYNNLIKTYQELKIQNGGLREVYNKYSKTIEILGRFLKQNPEIQRKYYDFEKQYNNIMSKGISR